MQILNNRTMLFLDDGVCSVFVDEPREQPAKRFGRLRIFIPNSNVIPLNIHKERFFLPPVVKNGTRIFAPFISYICKSATVGLGIGAIEDGEDKSIPAAA